MKRSKFSLSYHKLLTCDMGELIPCGVLEVLPGDTIQHATSALLRCSPLMAPVMHPVHVRIHHWFVPHRLVWDDFEDFITGGPDGNDDTEWPRFARGWAVGSIGDYLGYPISAGSLAVSALPLRAYQLIWNENYRDQDLQAEALIGTGSGVDTQTQGVLQHCNWEKDYLTSSRPWEQKGPAITIPIGTEAPVKTSVAAVRTGFNIAGSPTPISRGIKYQSGDIAENLPLVADLANASAVTVNILREALALQRFEEARARYGSRYTEYLRYLGVRSSDARLQRPEYLGGGKQTIQFSEVLQTAEGTDPVGEMRGHGLSAMRSNRYRRFFEEHGFIISLLSVRPKTIYTQAVPRMYRRESKEFYFQKELQHIGQQEVLNMEVYSAHSEPLAVFGYQDRYDEYRRQESSIAGEFRTTALNHWHLAREFTSDTALNDSFVKCVPTERVFAVPSNDVLWVMCRHSIQARRLVARRGSSFTF